MNRKTITGVFFLALLCVVPISMCAKSPYVFQSENPKANFAWDENDTTRYEGHYRFENAYQLIEDMLSDKCPLDFADAVFAVENCMYEGALDYSAYRMELERISNGVKQMAGSITAPSNDKISLMEDIGLTGGFVSHLLQTGSGTCHSLPYLYKMIADKVGAKAYIAMAPLHSYIRHQDAEGNWWNYETTTGTYSRSSFIMESFHVNEKAIRSGLYMTNLSDKETIVQCLYDLLCVYERKTGFYSNAFIRKCYSLGLKYHYPDNLHAKRINDLKYQLDKKAWNKGLRSEVEICNDAVLSTEYNYLQQQRKKFDEMGYHAFTTDEYLKKYQEALEYLQKADTKKSK